MEKLELELKAAELVKESEGIEPVVIRKRISHKREAPPRPSSKQSVSRQHSKEDSGCKDSSSDNCVMCIQERSEGNVPARFEGKTPVTRGLVRQQRCSSKEQRLVSRRSLQDYQSDNSTVQRFEGKVPMRQRFEGIAPVKNVQRSKSDAQDKLDFISDRQSVRTKFSPRLSSAPCLLTESSPTLCWDGPKNINSDVS